VIARRAFFAVFAREPKIPTEEAELNGFAKLYNNYVKSLQGGRVDLDAWRRVERAWRRMTE